MACADDTKGIAENDETNNCISYNNTLMVTMNDLVVDGVSDTPQTDKVGKKFVVFDNSVNIETVE